MYTFGSLGWVIETPILLLCDFALLFTDKACGNKANKCNNIVIGFAV